MIALFCINKDATLSESTSHAVWGCNGMLGVCQDKHGNPIQSFLTLILMMHIMVSAFLQSIGSRTNI